MTDRVKNYLGMTLIGFLIIIALVAINLGASYAQNTSQRSFVVSAQGKAVIIPDIAQFSYSIIVEGGNDIAGLQKQNTDTAVKVNDYLKEQGIDAKDIQTQDYGVEPRYQYGTCDNRGVCPPPQIVGYTIRQSVLVKVRDTKKAGDLLAGVVTSGANSVSQLTFTVDDRTTYENDARADAIKKAKEKANALASAGDFTLGRLLSIDEQSQQPPLPYAYGMGGAGDAVLKEALPPIEPGSQEVLVNVMLRYEIR